MTKHHVKCRCFAISAFAALLSLASGDCPFAIARPSQRNKSQLVRTRVRINSQAVNIRISFEAVYVGFWPFWRLPFAEKEYEAARRIAKNPDFTWNDTQLCVQLKPGVNCEVVNGNDVQSEGPEPSRSV
jgi:hypothetical protein